MSFCLSSFPIEIFPIEFGYSVTYSIFHCTIFLYFSLFVQFVRLIRTFGLSPMLNCYHIRMMTISREKEKGEIMEWGGGRANSIDCNVNNMNRVDDKTFQLQKSIA